MVKPSENLLRHYHILHGLEKAVGIKLEGEVWKES